MGYGGWPFHNVLGLVGRRPGTMMRGHSEWARVVGPRQPPLPGWPIDPDVGRIV